MLQGKEFIDFESDFIEFVKQDVRQGGFHTLLSDTGLCADEVIETLGMTEKYDCDYLDMDGELDADKLFSDTHIRSLARDTLRTVEVTTICIPSRLKEESILFMAVGESCMPGIPYTCYTYGFVTYTSRKEEMYYFHSMANVK